MYKYKYKYKYGFTDPRTSRGADSSLYEENPFIAQEEPSIFYKGRDETGTPFYVYPGVEIPDLRAIPGNWNDAISSVRVGENNRVRLYEHTKYRGGELVLKPGFYNLFKEILECGEWNPFPPPPCKFVLKTWENQASSLRVERIS
jgi:Beta/Gamma crystallin